MSQNTELLIIETFVSASVCHPILKQEECLSGLTVSFGLIHQDFMEITLWIYEMFVGWFSIWDLKNKGAYGTTPHKNHFWFPEEPFCLLFKNNT